LPTELPPSEQSAPATPTKSKVTDGWSEHFDSIDDEITSEEINRGADFNEELLRITPLVLHVYQL